MALGINSSVREKWPNLIQHVSLEKIFLASGVNERDLISNLEILGALTLQTGG